MRRILLLALLAIGLGQSHAADLFVANASFEDDPAADGTFPLLTPVGWSLYDPNGIVDNGNDVIGVVNPTGTTFFPAGVPDGRNAALVYVAEQMGGGPFGLSQVVDHSLQAGMTYTLRVAVGNIASGNGAPPFTQFFDLDGFPGYAVQLLAGGVVIAQDLNTLGGSIAEGTFGESVVSIAVGGDHPQVGGILEIRLLNLTQAGTAEAPGIEVDFDNVRLESVTTVPEPATWVMVLAGALFLFLTARRRKPQPVRVRDR